MAKFSKEKSQPLLDEIVMTLNRTEFTEHLARLRRGDAQAITEFVAKYEPYLRRSLRLRIRGSSLQSAADSVDICQSILGGFLLRLAAGNYELESENDLHRLLVRIANKKFLMFHRREYAAKRSRKVTLSIEEIPEVAQSSGGSVGREMEWTEVWNKAAQLMSSQERELLQKRKEGRSWEEISLEMNVNAALLRKRLSRAILRVSGELGLDDDSLDQDC